jgi:hypothetical protein
MLPTSEIPSPTNAPAASNSQGLAVASLVLSIVAIVLVLPPLHIMLDVVGIVCAIIGVICGHLALQRGQSNNGMAIAGLVVGYIAGALGVIHLLGLVLLGMSIRHRRL